MSAETMQASTVHAEDEEHGIENAYYALSGDMKYHPILVCLCHFSTNVGNDSWEEAGLELDAHHSGTK